jgi:TRAP-type uncharacterized transport system substrate-binding protein
LVTIGGGYTAGIYYQSANAIAKVINKRSEALGLRCKVVPTSGSSANVEEVTGGKVQFACVQLDVQFEAWNGVGKWMKKGIPEGLNAPIHPGAMKYYKEPGSMSAAEMS